MNKTNNILLPYCYTKFYVGKWMKSGKWVILFTHSPTEGGGKSVLLMLKVMTKLLLVTKQLRSG